MHEIKKRGVLLTRKMMVADTSVIMIYRPTLRYTTKWIMEGWGRVMVYDDDDKRRRIMLGGECTTRWQATKFNGMLDLGKGCITTSLSPSLCVLCSTHSKIHITHDDILIRHI